MRLAAFVALALLSPLDSGAREGDPASGGRKAPTERAARKPDPEGLPREGETPDEVDRRLGPWLDLKGGGHAVGDCQGTVVKNPDGTTTGAYGSLERGSPLPAAGTGFQRMGRPDSNFATGHMLSLLTLSAEDISRVYPGTVVHIGGIAKERGGFFPPHKSHQNGLDADLLYLGQTNWDSVLDNSGKVTERFDLTRNWNYWRSLVSQRFVENGRVDSIVSMILVDPAIKEHLCQWAKDNNALADPLNFEVMRRVRPTDGHDGHFHLRLQCSPHHGECKRGFTPPNASGCEQRSGRQSSP